MVKEYFVFVFLWDRISKCIVGWPWAHSVTSAGLIVILLPQILGITVFHHFCLSSFLYCLYCVCRTCVNVPRAPPLICLALVEAKMEWEGMRSLGAGVTGSYDLLCHLSVGNRTQVLCQSSCKCSPAPEHSLSIYKTLNLVGFYLFLMDVFSLCFVGFCFFSQSLNSFCLVPCCVHCVFSLERLLFYLYFSILRHSSWAVALMVWSDRQSFHHLCLTVGCLVSLETAGH